MWVPPEDADPIVLHAPTRKSIAVFGAVRIDDGRLVASRDKKFDALTFLTFLEKLLRHRRKARKMVVVLDNARYHHARLIQPWLKIKRNVLQLLFLPPYSPDFNPIERLWQHLKSHYLAGFITKSGEELTEKLIESIQSMMREPKLIRSVCNTHSE